MYSAVILTNKKSVFIDLNEYNVKYKLYLQNF